MRRPARPPLHARRRSASVTSGTWRTIVEKSRLSHKSSPCDRLAKFTRNPREGLINRFKSAANPPRTANPLAFSPPFRLFSAKRAKQVLIDLVNLVAARYSEYISGRARAVAGTIPETTANGTETESSVFRGGGVTR